MTDIVLDKRNGAGHKTIVMWQSFIYGMRFFVPLAAIGCLLALTGCSTIDRYGGVGTTWPGLTEVYTNGPSGFRFPPRIGAFERQQVTKYDREGQDIGVGYDNTLVGVAATIFVYPVPPQENTLSSHFLSCEATVLSKHDGAEIESDEAIHIPVGGVQRDGRHATFTYTQLFAEHPQAVRSELFLFENNQRFIMYRATYPLANKPVAGQSVRKLINQLAWP